MSLQITLNQVALNCFPKIQEHIKNENSFNANQMRCYTIQSCNNASISIDKQSSKQFETFQNYLIDLFLEKNWISQL